MANKFEPKTELGKVLKLYREDFMKNNGADFIKSNLIMELRFIIREYNPNMAESFRRFVNLVSVNSITKEMDAKTVSQKFEIISNIPYGKLLIKELSGREK